MEQGLVTTNPIPSQDWPSAWVRDATLIRFFSEDKEIAVIDGVTGLKWTLLADEPESPWVVDESTWPVADYWIFDATYLAGVGPDDRPIFRSIHEEGAYGGDGEGYAILQAQLEARTVSPWDYPGSSTLYAMYPERQARLDICHACELFDHAEGRCTVDESFMPIKTIDGGQVCPDNRWGLAPSWDSELADAKYAAAVVNVPSSSTDEQAAFEAEWEARHAG
jgi:hypothetical protein